jgi:DNA-binding CsgD family transcriptional regulator/PAS domain-containing protein
MSAVSEAARQPADRWRGSAALGATPISRARARARGDALPGVIGDIYQAAYDPAAWPAAVEAVRGVFHGSKACLVRVGPNRQPADLIAPNGDPAFQRRYLEEFTQGPNVLETAVAGVSVGAVYHDHALVGRDRLRASRLWNDWMAPQDMYGGLACKVLASGSSSWFLDVQRGRRQEGFCAADRALFECVAPHIQRAVEIGRQFQVNQALSSAFSHLPFGIIVVDGGQRIVTANEAAEAILAGPGGALRNKGGCLVAADARAAARLERLILEACSFHEGLAPGLGGDFQIAAPLSDERSASLAISVGPLLRGRRETAPVEPCAVVVVREMTLELPAGFADHIGALFNLTSCEAGVAAALAAGLSLKEAARRAEIKISTARTHLEHIFLKTGTRQQSQLVALLKTAQPALRRA